MSVIGSNIIAGASGVVADTGYQIARSLRFNSADSAYLNRTFGAVGNRSVWTWSGWIKRSKISAVQRLFAGGNGGLLFQANDTFLIDYDGGTNYAATPAVYRDVGAHCHVHVVLDTTQATATNRIKFWLNGVQQTLSFTGTIPLNGTGVVNNNVAHYIGTLNASSQYCDLLAADIRFIDGQALDPTSFGEFDANTGVWVPKAYTSTYGTNGFWLKFDDNSGTTSTTLGKDSSGNSNNWTPNNFSVTAGVGNDSLVDSPTNYGTDTGVGGEVRGNYATLNPLGVNGAAGTFSNGNLDYLTQNTDSRAGVATIPCNTGGSDKWYCEITIGSKTNTYYTVGVFSSTVNAYSNNPVALYRGDGLIALNGTSQGTFTSYTQNDVIGMSYNNSNGELKFYKNNTLITTLTLTSSTLFFFGAGSDSSGNTANYSFNFGQRPFAYTAPSGFKALCTTNLPTPAIGASAGTLASKNFNTVLYTGNGTVTGNTQAITGVGFQPDFTWIKSRSSGTFWNMLVDAVRGVNKLIYSNATDSEGSLTNVFNSFDSDGFTVAHNTAYSVAQPNASGATYVGWSWKANGAGVSNTAGTITSTVSANQTAGISVVTYTGNGSAGATVGHGLGVAPKFLITKSRSSVTDWVVNTNATGSWTFSFLNTTAAASADSTTAPTSSVFSRGSANTVNGSGLTYVTYAFAEVAGFSRFGSYTGNGSTDGPFVYCGFRPRWILIKRSDSAGWSWQIVDTARNNSNLANLSVYSDLANAETASFAAVDILSNGFKLRTTDAAQNASGGTYIFAAFAEAPFNYARAR